MQLTSSAFMPVAFPQPELRKCESMTTADSIRTWMNETLARTGLTVRAWAAAAGVAPSTIHRALKADYEFVTSSRTLARLASAADVPPPDTGSVEPVTVGARFLPIRYEVGAGLWQEVTEAQAFIGVGPVVPDPSYTGFPQWLERVNGDSMDREYRAGELIHVVDALALGYVPRHGDHVVLVRRRNDGSEMERTVKEVVRPAGNKPVEFWPRSTNPRWNAPIRLDPETPDDTSEVEVAGLVIGSYRPRRS